MKLSSFITGLAVGAVAALFVSKKLNECDCDDDCDIDSQDESSEEKSSEDESVPENI
ncbi:MULTISPECIES: hypothetical protein [unclassified Fibrobacter]|uniref:hypothetical protein n=1 Tax=unclassified Fibrobacter TaxID=2634177 RepID=UPI000D7931F3|nr:MULTISPECIES: hypothetical protein [unclassified Fibrobacter]PWJ62284.1 hypothetical protein BGX12_12210 [Fibrobacter sp. UWR4]PZW67976.1 hypothetical protein C8E88_102211 [Fibrobacter sp. UWR1]